MEYFGKCQTQPHKFRGKYFMCSPCISYVPKDLFVKHANQCQKCYINENKYHILYILQKASKSPGITYIYKKILFEYL